MGSKVYAPWGAARMDRPRWVWGSQTHGSLKYHVEELGLYPPGCGKGGGAPKVGGQG